MSKFLFVVQGEGRGHLTQAISLKQLLENAGHEVVHVLVGLPNNRIIPSFFFDEINTEVTHFETPSLSYGSGKENLSVGKTILNGFLRSGAFFGSIRQINQQIKKYKPDAIINFYELLTGIYNFIYRPTIPMICVGHQYLLLKADFIFPKNSTIDKFFLNLNTKLTALGASKKMALSFNKRANDEQKNIIIVPPLLRKEIKKLNSEQANEPFILVYMTIPAMAEELIKWHQKYPKVEIHCFSDRIQVEEEFRYEHNLTFHKIDSSKFLSMMQKCDGLVTTAGFESVCEAMSLGKPVKMIPVKNHFEQACNAIDGTLAGAGIAGKTFDLTEFLNFIPTYKNISEDFRLWQSQDKRLFLREIENCLFPQNNEALHWLPTLVIQEN